MAESASLPIPDSFLDEAEYTFYEPTFGRFAKGLPRDVMTILESIDGKRARLSEVMRRLASASGIPPYESDYGRIEAHEPHNAEYEEDSTSFGHISYREGTKKDGVLWILIKYRKEGGRIFVPPGFRS